MDAVAVVLAGGAGRRMGGAKAQARFRGERLVDRAAALGREVAGRAVVLAGPLDLRPHETIADPGDGPLVALLHAARAVDARTLLVLPCDMPLLDAPLLQEVLAAARGRDGAALRVDGWPQMLVAAYARAPLLAAAERLVAAGERGPKALARELDLAFVDLAADDPRAQDADTPEALARLER